MILKKIACITALNLRWHPNILTAHGKIKAITAFETKGGSRMRACVRGRNPNTTYQQVRKSQFTHFVQTWGTLSDAAISAWNVEGQLHHKSNKVGSKYAMAGFNLFVHVNCQFRVYGGSTDITIVPTFVGPTDNGPLANFDGPTTPSPTGMTVDVPAVASDDVLQLFATPCYSAGRTNVKGKSRPFLLIPTGTIQPSKDIFLDYVARLGTPVTGKKISIHSVYYNTVGHGSTVFETELSGKVK
jgi:hypothetical protein